jgi:hypothetical protein
MHKRIIYAEPSTLLLALASLIGCALLATAQILIYSTL